MEAAVAAAAAAALEVNVEDSGLGVSPMTGMSDPDFDTLYRRSNKEQLVHLAADFLRLRSLSPSNEEPPCT